MISITPTRSTGFKNSRWKTRREARKRWSLNAVRAKARIKEERLAAPIIDEPMGRVFVPSRTRPDLRVLLERGDGMKIQFSLHHFYGKLIGGTVNMSPRQFGRVDGEDMETSKGARVPAD